MYTKTNICKTNCFLPIIFSPLISNLQQKVLNSIMIYFFFVMIRSPTKSLCTYFRSLISYSYISRLHAEPSSDIWLIRVQAYNIKIFMLQGPDGSKVNHPHFGTRNNGRWGWEAILHFFMKNHPTWRSILFKIIQN